MTPGHIHVRCTRTEVGATNFESIDSLHISITGQDKLLAFRELLAKALNINYPEQDSDFRQLADILEFGKPQS